jgi:integrase/recombinase XerD
MKKRGDLFDVPLMWREDPIEAFAAFVGSVEFVELSMRKPTGLTEDGKPKHLYPLRDSSAAIYRFMWTRFVRWMGENNKSLWKLTVDDMHAFLDERDHKNQLVVKSATLRRQYLTMVDRVYKHFGFPTNPATHANHQMAGQTKLRGKNKATVTLTEEQQQAFLDALPFTPVDDDNPKAGWHVRRDRAMQAIMLGAGLKVSEAIGLYTVNVKVRQQDGDGNVPIEVSPASARGTVKQHIAMLRPPAASIVLDWVEERKRLRIPGQLLFPASVPGASARSLGARMDKSWVYRLTKQTYERAGLDVPRKGGRTLRNTYAVTELQSGQTDAAVKELLGHRTHRALETYTALLAPKGEKTRKA